MKNLFVAFVVSITTTMLIRPMDPPIPIVQREYPLSMQSMRFADDPDEFVEIIPQPLKPDLHADTFEGLPVKDLETILDNTNDAEIQHFNRYLSELNFIEHNYHFLIGEHGTGKTVLAKALTYRACKELNWTYEYMSAHKFIEPWRNQTAVQLREYLKKVSKLNEPTLLILDNLSLILEDTENSKLDTDVNTSILTNFLDKNQKSTKLCVLGILRTGRPLSPRLTSRIACLCTLLKETSQENVRRIIFTSKVIDDQTRLDPEITEEWLENYLRKNPTICGEKIRNFANHIKKQKKNIGPQSTITKNDLEDALSTYQEDNSPYRICPYAAALGVNFQHLHRDMHLQQLAFINNQLMQSNMAFNNNLLRQPIIMSNSQFRQDMIINGLMVATPIALFLYDRYKNSDCTIL